MGCGSSSLSSSNNQTATPSFSPGGGSYSTSQSVTISDTTPGAVLYCTTDGTAPTTSSPRCAQPTIVFKTQYLQAIAVAPGGLPSAVASAGYVINLNAASTPAFSPAGGTYSGNQQVTISDATAGANIYYTTDGSTPTTSSTLYTGPITVSSSQTLNAIAVASGYNNSGVASAAYSIVQPIATPIFSVTSGTYTSAQTVAISDATPSAQIYYVVNGSTPSASSTPYSGPITVSQTQTISAIAILSGNSSAVATAVYVISGPTVPAPTFSPAAGSISVGGQVSISDSDANATMYYTVDGSTPTSSSTHYSGPITLSVAGSQTIKAIAVDSGTSSSISSATYTVTASATPAPTFSPASGGAITTGQPVTISDTDAKASIYYTIDGSTPTASSTLYAGPITLSTLGSVTVQAIAIDSGVASGVATSTYTVSAAPQTLSGKVQSGTLAVSGAQVQIYGAGQSGYGSAATSLGSATTDSSGAFSVTFTCPAAPGDLVYLGASGGDFGSGANSSSQLMVGLGSCGALNATNSVVINEVTTVASAYALSAFITAAPDVGSSAGNYKGLSHAFATVGNLVDISTGAVRTITPAYASNPVPYLNNSTVPQARIDTLANVLNACVHSNGAGGGCTNLFADTTPASGTAPTNTLQAIVDLAQNPALNVAAVFGLADPSNGPFQPVLSAAPNDWTLALTFTGGGLGIDPATLPTATINGTTYTGFGPVIDTSLAIDGDGNIWVTAYAENQPATPKASAAIITPLLAKFNNLGGPITPATTLSSDATPIVTFGGVNPQPSVAQNGLMALALDSTGNAWMGDSNGNISEVGSDLSILLPSSQSNPHLGGSIPSMVFDASGNLLLAYGTNLAEYATDGTLTTLSGSTNSNLSYLNFDSSGNLWGIGLDSASNTHIYQIDSAGNVAHEPSFPSGVVSARASSLISDGSGNVYVCGGGFTELDTINGANVINSATLPSTRGCSSQLVLDGMGNIVAVGSQSTRPKALTVDVYTPEGVAISPAAGYTGTSSEESLTLNPDPNYAGRVPGVGAAIDGSGNLWVLNNDTNGMSSVKGNVLVEFIGIAAPVVTPTSVALSTGQLGVRP